MEGQFHGDDKVSLKDITEAGTFYTQNNLTNLLCVENFIWKKKLTTEILGKKKVIQGFK